jgi:hypothetical protein
MYGTNNSKIEFVSNAPLEIISAESDELQGLLDLKNKRFAFKMYIKSFEGFNSRLQQIHFLENYMESDEFPLSTFTGKIIESFSDDISEYRAKGILEIHGIKNEVIIPISINFQDLKLTFESNFKVRLEDHEITIPKLVYQKIAEVINVKVSGELILRQ